MRLAADRYRRYLLSATRPRRAWWCRYSAAARGTSVSSGIAGEGVRGAEWGIVMITTGGFLCFSHFSDNPSHFSGLRTFESLLATPVGFMVGLGGHDPDQLLALLVGGGAQFEKGKLVERVGARNSAPRATCWYSWMRPLKRSSLRTCVVAVLRFPGSVRSGACGARKFRLRR
jgi:hypothetical protein